MTAFDLDIEAVIDIPSEHCVKLKCDRGLCHIIRIIAVIVLVNDKEYALDDKQNYHGDPGDKSFKIGF